MPASPLEDFSSCGGAGGVDDSHHDIQNFAINPTASNLTIPIQRRHRILHCLRLAGPPVAVVVFLFNRLPCGAGESQGVRHQAGCR